jgi:hypothetical protein
MGFDLLPTWLQTEVLDGTQLKLTAAARTISPKDRDVVTLTKGDLHRMLKPSPIMTAEDVAAAKREAEAKREQLQAVSKARKEKMLKLEEEAKKQAPPTETEILQRQLNDATRSRATHILLEQKDQVKNMNQMVLYSKCVTIRDAQIEEKKQVSRPRALRVSLSKQQQRSPLPQQQQQHGAFCPRAPCVELGPLLLAAVPAADAGRGGGGAAAARPDDGD